MKSEPGRGSIFRVELPAASTTGAVAAPCRAVHSSPPPVAYGRILVIDDEPAVCQSLARLLASEGAVETTGSAKEALSRIEAGEHFDVLLCDLMMPGMDAPALYDALCKVAPAQAERMVFMTGGAFTARARGFLERAPNARVDKPFDVGVVRALVRARVLDSLIQVTEPSSSAPGARRRED